MANSSSGKALKSFSLQNSRFEGFSLSMSRELLLRMQLLWSRRTLSCSNRAKKEFKIRSKMLKTLIFFIAKNKFCYFSFKIFNDSQFLILSFFSIFFFVNFWFFWIFFNVFVCFLQLFHDFQCSQNRQTNFLILRSHKISFRVLKKTISIFNKEIKTNFRGSWRKLIFKKYV